MTKKYSTKRALFASLLALFMSFTMLIGTTFAWFTDSVSSKGNVIQTGSLDVAMYWVEATEDPATASEWQDAEEGAIFNNDKWEPGYTEAKHLKIANEGTLALKYQMRIIANGIVSELSDVIDVYYFDEATKLTNGNLPEANKLGTLTQALNVAYADNISTKIAGSLDAGKTKIVTLAFKMQESAGNEYQNLSIGSDFAIQILATQMTSESDSFDNGYDGGADFPAQETPAAMVYQLGASKLNEVVIEGYPNVLLDTGYSFQPTETAAQAWQGENKNWHPDFVVTADAAVPANSMLLAGYYSLFCDAQTNGNWVGLESSKAIEANTEVRLVGDAIKWAFPYDSLCDFGNDGTGFLCGAADLTGENAGTTITVELRLYETNCDCENTSVGGLDGCFECDHETGESITIGTFTYTFGGEYTTLDDGAEVFMADDGSMTLIDTANVTEETYYVPDSITAMNGGAFASNADIKTVVIPETVTDFGATGVSATNASGGAFKGSAVETVVLPEGMTEIPAAAFNGAKSITSVNIPSTVKTIGVNAFRQTAITELNVPETVETISYGAFRDMTSLTTVTIEGDNADVPNYAFRGCTNLRTVYLKGEDITVGTNMAFCNAESNNPGVNNITFYVWNTTVASRVHTSMGRGTDFWIYVGKDAETAVLATFVAPSDVESVDFAADGAYIFKGDFNGANVLVQSTANKTVLLDGANATNVGELIVNANDAIADHWDTVNGVDKDRKGSYTIKNFKSAKQISTFAYDTTVTIAENEVEFIGVYGGNIALDINGNKVSAKQVVHNMTNPGSMKPYLNDDNAYAVYLAIANYDLKFDKNEVTDAVSHAVAINGLQGQYQNATFTTNEIKSFSENKITLNSEEKEERAALKLWDDTIYAPNTSQTVQVQKAKDLQAKIKAWNNTFNLGEAEKANFYIEFYEVAIKEL